VRRTHSGWMTAPAGAAGTKARSWAASMVMARLAFR
jgi:hypothetical protein